MSKVKIQGNASGTGVVTLTAPNTNTDRTITLPDETVSLTGAPAGLDDVGGVARATSGLLFNGDTAAANALDDYEEGTWTGTVVVGSGTFNVIEEKYTKIGRLVHLYFEVNFSGASGGLTVAGLPFTASPDGAVGIGREDAANGYAVYARISTSNQISVFYAGSTSNATPYQVGTGNFKISITYNV